MPDIDAGLLAAIAAITAAAGFLIRQGWRAWPFVQKLVRLVDDLAGHDERPGVPARPGVMTRLANVEGEVAAVKGDLGQLGEQVEKVKAEIEPNGGGSIKDATVAMREDVGHIKNVLVDHLDQFAAHIETTDQRYARLEGRVEEISRRQHGE